MPLQYLRVFRYIDAVARTGSIRKAAESLFITPSALDRRVQDLEAALGTELFERHARGVRLTAAGEVFIQHIRVQRADFERARTEIEHLKGLRKGSVSIAASQAMAFHVLPALLNRFREAYPGITFSVRVCDRASVIKALREFDVDIGLVYNVDKSPDITTFFEIEQSMCAVMAEQHPLAGKTKLRMHDCLKYPVALPDASIGGRALLENFFAHSSLQPRIVLESNSFEMLRHFVRSNDAITFQIEIGTSLNRVTDGVIARTLNDTHLAKRSLSIVQLKGRPLSLPAMRLLEMLKSAWQ